jgi:hypothetical protein
MGEGGRRGAWREVARGRSGGRARELLVVSKKKINTKKAKKTRLTVAPDAGTSWSHGGEWGRGMRWPEGGWRGGTVARAPCQPVVTHVMPHRVAVEWRGVWVGSVTERTRVEKKKEKHDVPSWMVLAGQILACMPWKGMGPANKAYQH